MGFRLEGETIPTVLSRHRQRERMPLTRTIASRLEIDPKKMLERPIGLPEVTVLGLFANDKRVELHIESISDANLAKASWPLRSHVQPIIVPAATSLRLTRTIRARRRLSVIFTRSLRTERTLLEVPIVLH